MDRPVTPLRSAEPPAELQERIPCFGCGYALEGLMEDGACPECGMRVSNSVGHFRRGTPRTLSQRLAFPAALAALWLLAAGVIVATVLMTLGSASTWTFVALLLGVMATFVGVALIWRRALKR